MEGYKLSSWRTADVSSEIRETSYTVGELSVRQLKVCEPVRTPGVWFWAQGPFVDRL